MVSVVGTDMNQSQLFTQLASNAATKACLADSANSTPSRLGLMRPVAERDDFFQCGGACNFSNKSSTQTLKFLSRIWPPI